MATDGPTPDPCDPEIFEHGTAVLVLNGASNAVERYVRTLARVSGVRMDWHYVGGRAVVRMVGDSADWARVLAAALNEIDLGAPYADVRVLRAYAPDREGGRQ